MFALRIHFKIYLFIVGLQKDRRDEAADMYEKWQIVSTQMGRDVADDLKLSNFMEVSALRDQQVIILHIFISDSINLLVSLNYKNNS